MDNLLSHLKVVLSGTPQRWQNFCEQFDEDLLRRQPLPGEWSALECLAHLIELDQQVFPVRTKVILAGENFPAFKATEDYATAIKDRSPLELAQEFQTIRTENLAFLETVQEGDLVRTAIHPVLGEISLSALLHEWGGHDLMHTVQAEQAMMQPFIAGCGAFDVFFEAHLAKAE